MGIGVPSFSTGTCPWKLRQTLGRGKLAHGLYELSNNARLVVVGHRDAVEVRGELLPGGAAHALSEVDVLELRGHAGDLRRAGLAGVVGLVGLGLGRFKSNVTR